MELNSLLISIVKVTNETKSELLNLLVSGLPRNL